MEYNFRDLFDDFLSFRWLHRGEQRRTRKPHTTRANKHTAQYRAKRDKRNQVASMQRKINRQRAG